MMQIILVGGWASFLCGVKAAGSQAWLSEEEGQVEGLKMLQVKHAKVDNVGKRLEALSAASEGKEVVLLQGIFEQMGAGCCSGPRDVENGHMWSGRATDLTTCQSRCRGFENCGAVEYGWSGDADKDWCVIWNDMQTCSKLETGPEKCGNNSAGVRAYTFKKHGMTQRAASQEPQTSRLASEDATLAQQDEVVSPVATGMPGQMNKAPASIAQEAAYQQASSWECHLYNASAGQDDDWCMRTKQHQEYAYLYTGGKAKVCGGCWCCKSRLFQVAPEPARNMLSMDSNASLKEVGADEGLPEQVVAGSRHHLATLKIFMELIQAAPLIAFIGALLFGIIGAVSSSLWQRKVGSSAADRTDLDAGPPPEPHPNSVQRCNCFRRKGSRGRFGISCAWHTANPKEGLPASEPSNQYMDEGLAKEADLKQSNSADGAAKEGEAAVKAAEEAEQELRKEEVAAETAAAEQPASEKGAAEKAAAEKAVADKAAAARVVAEQAAAAKVALEKAVADLAAAEEAAAAGKISAKEPVVAEAEAAVDNSAVEQAEEEKWAIAIEEAVEDESNAKQEQTMSPLASSLPSIESAVCHPTPSDPMSEWWHNDLDTNISEQNSAASVANFDISGADKAATDQVLEDNAAYGKEEEADKAALENAVVGIAPEENSVLAAESASIDKLAAGDASVNTETVDKTSPEEHVAKDVQEEEEEVFLDAEGEMSIMEEAKDSA